MSRRKVFIAGASGFGRELFGWIDYRNNPSSTFEVSAFVDDSPERQVTSFGIDLPVLGPKEAAALSDQTPFVLGVADPRAKEMFAHTLMNLGLEPLTYVHDSVLLGHSVKLGRGAVVCPRGVLSCNIEIGEFVHVNVACCIGHDVRIGSYSTLFGSNCINGSVTIGRGVKVGSGAVIHPGKSIGDAATIGIGSVVVRSVPAEVTVFGNPATKL